MSRYLDNVIASLRSLYLAMISFIVIYAYVALSLFAHNQALSNLIALDKLLALRQIAKSVPSLKTDKLILKDAPQFFFKASEDFSEELQKLEEKLDAEIDEALKEDLDSKPGEKKTDSELQKFNEPIDRAGILKDVPMRLAVGAVCDVVVTQLLPGRQFTFATLQVVSGFYTVKSEDTRLFSFSRCAPGQPKEFNALIFSLPNGQAAFAIPRSLEEEFPGLKVGPLFRAYIFQDVDGVKKFLPPQIAKYADLDGSFVTLHIRAIDYFILNYARFRIGKFFRADEVESAAEKLYEEKEKDASYLGLTTTSTNLVRLGPLIFFAFSFVLWLRVRLLPIRKLRSDEYWFVFETNDWVGRAYAYLSAVAPFLFGIIVYVLFAVSQNLAQPMFGYMVSLQGLLRLEFPPAPPSGWLVTDAFASVIGLTLSRLIS